MFLERFRLWWKQQSCSEFGKAEAAPVYIQAELPAQDLDILPTPVRRLSRCSSRGRSRSRSGTREVADFGIGAREESGVVGSAAHPACNRCLSQDRSRSRSGTRLPRHRSRSGSRDSGKLERRQSLGASQTGRSSMGSRRPSLPSRARLSVKGGRIRRSLAAKARSSFPHRDFANPEAETCWLSCLFQSLWHSVVFHTIFDRHLTKERYEPADQEAILLALQQTWEEYTANDPDDVQGTDFSAVSDPAAAPEEPIAECAPKSQGSEHLVPASDLAEAFGEGYGDMSEALANLQQELSESPNAMALILANAMLTVPLSAIGGMWPTPEMAWSQLEEWQATQSPLIAVDLSSSISTKEGIERLAQLWIPGSRSADAALSLGGDGDVQHHAPGAGVDLGSSHRIVALVCYMWNVQHYVTFCCRFVGVTIRRNAMAKMCILKFAGVRRAYFHARFEQDLLVELLEEDAELRMCTMFDGSMHGIRDVWQHSEAEYTGRMVRILVHQGEASMCILWQEERDPGDCLIILAGGKCSTD